MACLSWCRGNPGSTRKVRGWLLLLGALLIGAQPARAGLDYCSTDPVFTFVRDGGASHWVLDVQVMVPLQQLPLPSAARLDVTVPHNVAVAVVNPPNPIFPVDVSVDHGAASASSDPYQTSYTLLVPESGPSFPVRLLITDPLDGSISIYDGVAGRPLTVRLRVGQ